MKHSLFPLAVLIGWVCCDVPVAAAEPAEDAAALYLRAAGERFEVESPAETAPECNEYPPYPPEWHRLAKAAREANAPRLALARQARTNGLTARWPKGEDLRYLNRIRSLTNELGDAALYEHTQGNDAEAVEFARDVLSLGKSLRTGRDHFVIQVLVGVGVELSVDYRLMVMAPGLSIAKDGAAAADAKHVSPAVLRDVIKQLLEPRDVKAEVATALAAEPAPKPGQPTVDVERLTVQLNRSVMEQGLLAMSLACQLYRTEKGTWPATSEQLVPAYLPTLPTDPFGDGKQTLGYVLVKGGLPDGGDRPLVYSRDTSKDGLFYRLDEPRYSFYRGDGSDPPHEKQKQGGQFRDVSLWVPGKLAPGAPKTRALD